MPEKCTLYKAPCSLYTGKARSYLIKQGIAFREIAPGAPEFNEDNFFSLDPGAQNDIKALLKELDLDILLDLKLHRQIARRDNLEIWL